MIEFGQFVDIINKLPDNVTQMICGYVLVDIAKIRDSDRYARYREAVHDSFGRAGGEYLVRGGDPVALLGDWSPSRLVIARFPSVLAILNWWSSEDYRAIKADRVEATDSRFLMFAAEDVDVGEVRAFALIIAKPEGDAGTGIIPSFVSFAGVPGSGRGVTSRDIIALEGTWCPPELGLAGFPDRDTAARCVTRFRLSHPAAEKRASNSVILLSGSQKITA